MVVVEAAFGGVLLLTGTRPPTCTSSTGLLPIVVSLIAEQLKISAATQILDARGLEDAQAVGGLPAANSGRSCSRSCAVRSAR